MRAPPALCRLRALPALCRLRALPALCRLRALPALTQAFLDRVLHQHRNVLRHPRTLVTVGFPVDGVANLA